MGQFLILFPIWVLYLGSISADITYYSEEMVLRSLIGQIEGNLMRQKREPISLTLALILGAGLARSSTGIAALALHDKNYKSLKANIDEDIQ